MSLHRGTNGLGKPSAAPAAAPRSHTAKGLRYGNRLFSRDFTPASTAPPPPPPPPGCSAGTGSYFFPARSFGLRLRRRRAVVRAAARVSFIGFALYVFAIPERALSFFNTLFSRPFRSGTAFPLLLSSSQEADILTPHTKVYSYC